MNKYLVVVKDLDEKFRVVTEEFSSSEAAEERAVELCGFTREDDKFNNRDIMVCQVVSRHPANLPATGPV